METKIQISPTYNHRDLSTKVVQIVRQPLLCAACCLFIYKAAWCLWSILWLSGSVLYLCTELNVPISQGQRSWLRWDKKAFMSKHQEEPNMYEIQMGFLPQTVLNHFQHCHWEVHHLRKTYQIKKQNAYSSWFPDTTAWRLTRSCLAQVLSHTDLGTFCTHVNN